MNAPLAGKNIIVAGGSGSIGSAFCNAFARQGASVFSMSRREGAVFEHNSIVHQSVNFTDESAIQAARQKLLDQGKTCDVLILSLGKQIRKNLLEFTADEWKEIIDSQLTAAFFAIKTFLPDMIAKKNGRILAVTSLTSTIGIPNIVPYGAAKGGLLQLIRGLAVETAPMGVTCNAISPGRIKTVMTHDLLNKSAVENLSRIPMGRLGDPADLVGAGLFLCSESAAYITGQELVIDGGWLASGGNISG